MVKVRTRGENVRSFHPEECRVRAEWHCQEDGRTLRDNSSGCQEQYYQGAQYGWKGFVEKLEQVVARLN